MISSSGLPRPAACRFGVLVWRGSCFWLVALWAIAGIGAPLQKDLGPTVLPERVDIDMDTDRNGTVEDGKDDIGEATWSKKKGANIYAGQQLPGVSEGTVIYNLLDPDIAHMVIRRVKVPAGHKLVLSAANADKILLFALPVGTGSTPIAFVDNKTQIADSDVTADIEYLVLAREPEGPDRKITLRLTLVTAAGAEEGNADAVEMCVAPLIVSWNGLPKDKIYQETDVWWQDIAELVSSPIAVTGTDPVTGIHTVKTGHILINLGPGTHEAIFDVVQQTENDWQRIEYDNNYTEYTGGNGGNIEATPPTAIRPFGCVYYGDKYPYSAALVQLNKQKIQPQIELPTNWLYVGHVDETVAFTDDHTLLVADPMLAMNILHGRIIAQWDATENLDRIPYFDTNHDYNGDKSVENCMVGIRELIIDATASHTLKRVRLPTGMALPASGDDVTITIPDCPFEVHDLIRIEDEFVVVKDKNGDDITLGRGGQTAVTDRWHVDSVPALHNVGTPMYALNQFTAGIGANLNNMTASAPQQRLHEAVDALAAKISATTVTKLIPVLFGYRSADDYSPGGYYAGTSNMINCLVTDGTVSMANPHYAPFWNAFTLSPAPVPVDVWQARHVNFGEIHCATNVKRKPTYTKLWWEVWPVVQ